MVPSAGDDAVPRASMCRVYFIREPEVFDCMKEGDPACRRNDVMTHGRMRLV
jgi:hypothetical protein